MDRSCLCSGRADCKARSGLSSKIGRRVRGSRIFACRVPSASRKEGRMTQSKEIRGAFYARVSSDKQAEEGTIASQVAALQERLRQDNIWIEEELSFVDDGYTGTTLVRPALERLRDLAATGALDRLY